ncbi:MAG: twin-arginine translocase TatA/TatE family subunit [Streptosporangiales bacterium]|nr:twin-arginine translocase TatA/TatE family subunit [Streptosporangiales bacterium]
MPNLGAGELIIIAVVMFVLFGSAKLPDAARSLGRSLRIFKAETRRLDDDQPTRHQPTDPQLQQPGTTGSDSAAGSPDPAGTAKPRAEPEAESAAGRT